MPSLRTRASGLLLHPTSLPEPAGAGDLGPAAHRFVDDLAAARQSWWMMLPIGPTGVGNSPYSALSSFAGNPLLVSLDDLVARGWLDADDARCRDDWPRDVVPFNEVGAFREHRLRRAAARFFETASDADRARFHAFRAGSTWLPDWALYRALKDVHGGAPWTEWEPGVRGRVPQALDAARRAHERDLRLHEFVQFAFHEQWAALRAKANGLGVGLIGDVPFYVPHDSAEVWANQDLFDLNRKGRPMRVAGVPPDEFSKVGQLWGFPLYKWDAMRARGWDWWLSRFKVTLDRFDAVRIDHFIGFHRAWAVPSRLQNALRGRWIPGPDGAILEALRASSGPLELVAEDLGVVTPEVTAVRERFDLPGIRVLQFGFGWDPAQTHLPHTYPKRCMAATGTHDNDTSAGWYASIDHPGTKDWIHRYLRTDGVDVHWTMIQGVLDSVADTAILPVQDLLGLGSEARMNKPGVATGNWGWRLLPGQVTPAAWERFRSLTEASGRAR